MGQISLKKIISKKEGLSVIKDMVNAIGTAIAIQDADGRNLIGNETENFSGKYPVYLAGEVIGWVRGEEKSSAVASLLSYMAKQELEKKTLAKELLEKYQEIDLFHDISTQLTASLDLKEVAHLVIDEARKLIDSSQGSIMLLNQKTGELDTLSEFGQGGDSCRDRGVPHTEKNANVSTLAACRCANAPGYEENASASTRALPVMLGEGIVGSIVQTGKGEIVNDVSTDPRFVNSLEPISSLICVPLKTKEQVIGAIAISSETPVTYSAGDLKLLNMFASQAAVAIEKALLYEQSRTAAIVAQDRAQQLQRTLYELQQTQAQLIQSEKMSSLGQMVAGVAHEINNPVNFIYGNLNHAHQYLEDLLNLVDSYQQHYPEPPCAIAREIEAIDLDFLKEDFPRLLDSMKVGGDRIRQIIVSLRNFSRLDQAEMKPVDIHEGIDSTLLILQHRLKATASGSAIQVIKKYGQLPKVECYASGLNQVFMNIINNAIDALDFQEEPRIITIWTEVSSQLSAYSYKLKAENSVVIRISDNGPGMSEAVRKQMFDPFFTTKPIGKGTGLGLSISYHIVVEKHGGVLRCISQPGEGTEFAILIPMTPGTKSHRERQGQSEAGIALTPVG